jgi:Fe-S cluster biogenesis protein NfuA
MTTYNLSAKGSRIDLTKLENKHSLSLTRSTTMELTTQNVETVLDEMRPYLMSDGGNVELVELDGPVVKLRLQGACGSCPSSAMTLRMGIERRLREMIPEIAEVEQVM